MHTGLPGDPRNPLSPSGPGVPCDILVQCHLATCLLLTKCPCGPMTPSGPGNP